MVRGRRNAKREAALGRQLVQQERQAAELRASRKLIDRWGDEQRALSRLSAIASELGELHQEQAALLRERDDLVLTLRQTGSSWSALSSRTNLSRQALMKRI
jgi:hypothetical protein